MGSHGEHRNQSFRRGYAKNLRRFALKAQKAVSSGARKVPVEEEIIVGVVALVAIVLALVSLGRAQSLSERAAKTEKLLAELERNQPQAQSTAGKPSQSADVPTDAEKEQLLQSQRGLVSSVRVLELRAKEHDALLCALVTEDEARHLWNLSRGKSSSYELFDSTGAELRSLVRRGLIAKRGEFRIHELPHRFELDEHFELTEAGTILLDLRKTLEESDLRAQASLPPSRDS